MKLEELKEVKEAQRKPKAVKVPLEVISSHLETFGGLKVQPPKRLTIDHGVPKMRLGGFPNSDSNNLQRGAKLSQKQIAKRKTDEEAKWEKARKRSYYTLQKSKEAKGGKK